MVVVQGEGEEGRGGGQVLHWLQQPQAGPCLPEARDGVCQS